CFFFFQAEDGIRDRTVTGVQTCALPIFAIYRMWKPRDWWRILRDTTRESVMILMIIAAAVLFGYMLTSLYLTQTLAQSIADMHRSEERRVGKEWRSRLWSEK